MKTACFIPIKSNSERVPGKNFRILNGKKLYEYILEHVVEANIFDDIYVDTNSEEIMEYAEKFKDQNVHAIWRKDELATNSANGNDLIVYHRKMFTEYDYYFQLFATAPYLQPKTIRKCVEAIINSEEYDSCFTATENYGFFWLNKNPINYRPGILPRSQDLTAVLEESTGLYGISKESIDKYQCRIGSRPYIRIIDKFEAVDINTEEDLKVAEFIGRAIFNL